MRVWNCIVIFKKILAYVAQQLIPDHKFYEPIGEFVIWDQVVVIPSLDGTIGVKNG